MRAKIIKSLKTLQNIMSSDPRTISQGENSITNPYGITKTFNN